MNKGIYEGYNDNYEIMFNIDNMGFNWQKVELNRCIYILYIYITTTENFIEP